MPIAADSSSGNFLVSPNVGVMIWTLIAFGITLLLLRKLVFPRITDALARRQKLIDDSINSSQDRLKQADELLAEYRQRLAEARGQAEEIVTRARTAGEHVERESREKASEAAAEAARHAQRDIEAATRRALSQIRSEVADLTLLATEKVTRRALDSDRQRQLVQEAIGEIDFSVLAGVGEGDGES